MNIFERYDSAADAVTTKVKAFVTDFFPYLLVLINIVFMVVNTLYEVGFQNPFASGTLIKTLLNCATSTLSYGCFVTYGENYAKRTMKGYLENCDVWAATSTRIRTGPHFEAFLDYCKEMVEKEREERRIAIITNRTRITVKEFNDIYRGMSRKDLLSLVREGKISRTEAHFILKASGNIRVKPINPLILLCGTRMNNLNDAGRAEGGSAVKSIALKPLITLTFSIVVGGISCVYTGVADGSAIFQMLCSAFLILTSALMGYSAGYNNVVKTNDAIKSRIVFIERFEKNV